MNTNIRFFFSVLIALMIYHYLDATPVSTTESLSTDKPIRVPSYYYGQTVTINVYRWLVSTYGQNAVNTAGVISLDNRYEGACEGMRWHKGQILFSRGQCKPSCGHDEVVAGYRTCGNNYCCTKDIE